MNIGDTQVTLTLTILEVCLIMGIGTILFVIVFIEQYRIRNTRHSDRDALSEVNSKIESIRLDNQQLGNYRAQVEQLKLSLEQTQSNLWIAQDRNKKLEDEKALLIRGGYGKANGAMS